MPEIAPKRPWFAKICWKFLPLPCKSRGFVVKCYRFVTFDGHNFPGRRAFRLPGPAGPDGPLLWGKGKARSGRGLRASAGWKLSRDGSGVPGRGSREGRGPGGDRAREFRCAGRRFSCGSWRRVEVEPGWFWWRWAAGLGRDSGWAGAGTGEFRWSRAVVPLWEPGKSDDKSKNFTGE